MTKKAYFKVLVGCIMILIHSSVWADTISDAQAVRAIIGEASNQGYVGMYAVASGIRNRGSLKGVYGLKAKHVDLEPKWVWDMARKAWKESKVKRLHIGDYWENIKTFGTPSWVKGMKEVYRIKDHVFYAQKG